MKEHDVRTVKRSVTLRKDVYDALVKFRRIHEYKGMRCLRESTLITLILEWAFKNGLTEKAVLELYAEGNYARIPDKPRGLGWEKLLFEKERN